MKERPGWFWPDAVQALLAHDPVFQLVSSLKDPTASTRAVELDEYVSNEAGAEALSLVAQCSTAETCLDVQRMLQAVVPSSPARPLCDAPDGTPTTRSVKLDKETLLPITDAGASTMAPEAACARLSACARHENERADPRLAAKCLSSPRSYALSCAVQLTCFDVATCAHLKASAGPVFSPFSDLSGQVWQRGVRLGRGLTVADLGGGGGLDPTQLSIWFEGIGDQSNGTWSTVLLSFEVGAKDRAQGYYGRGSGQWAVAFIRPNGSTVLGPGQRFAATTYNAVGLPGAIGLQPTTFDYDADGSLELLLPVSSAEHANSGTRGFQIWTLQQGKIMRYPHTEALPIMGVEDVDNDGRPDLVLDLDNSLDQEGGHSSFKTAGSALAHSLSDGTFSTVDAVARGYSPTP